MEFSTEKDCSAALQEQLNKYLSRELAAAIASNDELLAELSAPENGSEIQPSSDGFVTRFDWMSPDVTFGGLTKRWAIRDEDVDLLASLVEGLASTSALSAGAFLLFGAPMTPAAIAGATAACFVFFRKVKKLRAKLSDQEFYILRCLRSSSTGRSLDELEGALSWAKIDMTRAEVEAVVERLKAFRLEGGKVVPLVNCDASGKWSVVNI